MVSYLRLESSLVGSYWEFIPADHKLLLVFFFSYSQILQIIPKPLLCTDNFVFYPQLLSGCDPSFACLQYFHLSCLNIHGHRIWSTCGQCRYMRHSFLTLGQSSWSDLRLCAYPQLETSSKPVVDPHHSELQTEETALPSVSSWNQSKTKTNHVIACILSNSHDFLWPWLTCIMLHHGDGKGKGGSQADRGRLLLIWFFFLQG